MTLETDRTPEEERAIMDIVAILRTLAPEQRASVFLAIRFNDEFCVHCGHGSKEYPNPNCQCMNDE